MSPCLLYSRSSTIDLFGGTDTKEKPYACQYCDQIFSRGDLVQRHILIYHSSHQGATPGDVADHHQPRKRPRTRVACDYCSRTKVKCDGKSPCSRCTKKGTVCTVSPSRISTSSSALSRDVDNDGDVAANAPLPSELPSWSGSDLDPSLRLVQLGEDEPSSRHLEDFERGFELSQLDVPTEGSPATFMTTATSGDLAFDSWTSLDWPEPHSTWNDFEAFGLDEAAAPVSCARERKIAG